MDVEGTIKRIGGSIFVRLPPGIADRLHLHDGDLVHLDGLSKHRKTLAELADGARRRPVATKGSLHRLQRMRNDEAAAERRRLDRLSEDGT